MTDNINVDSIIERLLEGKSCVYDVRHQKETRDKKQRLTHMLFIYLLL
jgi:hypothetical protein